MENTYRDLQQLGVVAIESGQHGVQEQHEGILILTTTRQSPPTSYSTAYAINKINVLCIVNLLLGNLNLGHIISYR